ncbi:MAG TPA: TlpA disulfide reductase family protein [Bacillales bacterium]|nr:TlpA disulfide reductase family protein [Bacillales bacterium]
MNKIIWLILGIAVGWIVLGTFDNQENQDDPASTASAERPAPAFELPSLQGKTYSLQQASGQPLVINFWNTWCKPCRKETPELVKLYETWHGQFQLYGINITANDMPAAARAFAEDFNIPYPILLDKQGNVSERYNVIGMPTTYFINAKGIIVDKIVGYQGPDVLRDKVKALLDGK